MRNSFVIVVVAICGFVGSLMAADQVLVVADEMPAMQVLAEKLEAGAGVETALVTQAQMPAVLQSFKAVAVYIHGDLTPNAEKAFIEYTRAGGKLIALHHSISSNKRKNPAWLEFLGIRLPEGGVEAGGYQWIEPATIEVVNLQEDHFITTQQISFPFRVRYNSLDHPQQKASLPGFILQDSEVYLNHGFTRPRFTLLGFKYTEPNSGAEFMQDRAGWYLKSGKGWVFYYQPGHSAKEFEHPVFSQILVNTFLFDPETQKPYPQPKKK